VTPAGALAPCAALLALFVASAPADAAAEAADLRAERITEASAPELLIGGPDAIGGIGDWYLANDVVEFVVDDPERRHGKQNHGGTIVDAGRRDRRNEDQFARLFPIVNLDQRVQLNFDAIRAEVDDEGRFARLVVWSRRGLSSVPRGGALARRFHPLVPETREIEDVRVQTTYELRPGEPWLRIATRIRNEGERPAPVFAYGDVWMRGGRSIRSFVGNTLQPERSRGPHHLSFDRRNLLASNGAFAPFTFVAGAGMFRLPPIAYALFAPERAARGLRFFGVTGEHVTFANGFLGDPGWETLGILSLLSALRFELEPGASWRFERRLLVAGSAHVAAATDAIFPELRFADGSSGIRGRIEPAGLRCVVQVDEATTGAPLTQTAVATHGADAGRYRATLPSGSYVLTLRAPDRPERRLAVSVEPGRFAELPVTRFAESAWLVFAPAFADGGPGRVVVQGVDGTPDPVFEPELLDFRLDGQPVPSGSETRELHFVGTGADPRRVPVRPGRYRLTATRGPEFDAARTLVELAAPGAETRVPPFELGRIAVLPDAVSADLHVHAEASDDSGMSNEARLRSFVAEHVEVMVSTDHDHVARFGPALDALGVRDRIRVVHGAEVTGSAPADVAPWTIGHHNAWPLRHEPLLHRRGAPPSQDLSVAELYSLLRLRHGAEVVQMNHPLGKEPGFDDGAYLTHLGTAGRPFDPARPLSDEPNRRLLDTASDGRTRAIDFDAIELMNGSDFDQYVRVREVWLALLRQGYRRAATGNSDSHGPAELAGYPRNYVFVGERLRGDADALAAAVRAGRSFATTGPLVTRFEANGAGIGELAASEGGAVRVEFAVVAAPWVPVDEVRLLVDGKVATRFPSRAAGEAAERFRLARSVELSLRRDAFLILEAGAPLDVDPAGWRARHGGLYAGALAPGFVSQAITNPIFVDVDGNGRFDAPGLDADGAGGAAKRLVVTAAAVVLLAVVWWRLRARAQRGGLPRLSGP
jgi:hypothetical protein